MRFVLVGGLAVNDVLQGLPQVPPFAALEEKAKMKRSSERPRDREDLAALEAVEEEGQQGK